MQHMQFQGYVDVHEQMQEMQHPLVGICPKENSDTSHGEVGEWGARVDEEPGGEGTERGEGCSGSLCSGPIYPTDPGHYGGRRRRDYEGPQGENGSPEIREPGNFGPGQKEGTGVLEERTAEDAECHKHHGRCHRLRGTHSDNEGETGSHRRHNKREVQETSPRESGRCRTKSSTERLP